MRWEQALGWRMRRQRLVERAGPSDLLDVVTATCGLHAQLMSSAELSLWARVDCLPREAVDEALWRRRQLVKLWAMRGTLHLLPVAELGVWISALSTYTNRGNTRHPEVDALVDAVGHALRNGPLTREELADAVERITGDPSIAGFVRFSWGSYLKPACFRGLLCFGPAEGGRVRFTTLASWLPEAIDRPEPAEALREVARRYLAAYGPATAEDLGLWFGVGPARGRRMVAALGEEAAEVEVEGTRAWALASDVAEMAAAPPAGVARLLPAFDPWVAGASRRSAAVIDPAHRSRVYRPQGWFSPVLLVDGRIEGVWKHTQSGRRLRVEMEPFGRLPAWARDQLEAEAERLAAFLDAELSIP